jgi:translation initiation factor IF-1
MSRKNNPDIIEIEGVVKKLLPGTLFDVELTQGDNKTMLLCSLAGKLKQHFIKLTVGDRVTIELSKYDLSKGRITYRLKQQRTYATSKKSVPFKGGGVGKRKK